MGRDRSRGLAALLAVVAALAWAPAAAPAAPALRLGRCPAVALPELDAWDREQVGADRSRCGRVDVPLDRSGAIPGRVGLLVRVQPPARGRATGTVLALAGGPGQPAASLLEGFAQTLGSALAQRRLVAFDQRGTGGSGRLRCPSLRGVDRLGEIGPAVAACADRLGPRRAAYTSAASVQDVEAVREAIGAPQLILYGTSYGTKVALDYAAAHPQRVERLVLDSVVPPAGQDPFQRASFRSVPRVLAALCGRRGCPFTDDPGADVATLVQRIARDGVLRSRWLDRRGRPHRIAIGRGTIFSMLLAGDGDPLLRAAFPAAARSAVEGDLAPLARLAAASRESADEDLGVDEALYVATVCADGRVPWPDGTPVPARAPAAAAELAAVPAAELAPFDAGTLRASPLWQLCRTWPESPVPQPLAPLPAVPALLLSGAEDVRTPLEEAQQVAAALPGSRLLAVPRTGHSVLGSDLGSCSGRALAAFLDGRPVRDCRRPRRSLLQPARLVPARFAEIRPQRGYSARVGRTIAAVRATLRDVDQQGAIVMLRALFDLGDSDRIGELAWGGLRSGYATTGEIEREEPFRLRGYSAVPGVVLDARDVASGAAKYGAQALRVSGAAAAHGRLRLEQGLLTGRLGTERVRLQIGPKPERVRVTVGSGNGPARSAAAVAAAAASRAGVASTLPPAIRGR